MSGKGGGWKMPCCMMSDVWFLFFGWHIDVFIGERPSPLNRPLNTRGCQSENTIRNAVQKNRSESKGRIDCVPRENGMNIIMGKDVGNCWQMHSWARHSSRLRQNKSICESSRKMLAILISHDFPPFVAHNHLMKFVNNFHCTARPAHFQSVPTQRCDVWMVGCYGRKANSIRMKAIPQALALLTLDFNWYAQHYLDFLWSATNVEPHEYSICSRNCRLWKRIRPHGNTSMVATYKVGSNCRRRRHIKQWDDDRKSFEDWPLLRDRVHPSSLWINLDVVLISQMCCGFFLSVFLHPIYIAPLV